MSLGFTTFDYSYGGSQTATKYSDRTFSVTQSGSNYGSFGIKKYGK